MQADAAFGQITIHLGKNIDGRAIHQINGAHHQHQIVDAGSVGEFLIQPQFDRAEVAEEQPFIDPDKQNTGNCFDAVAFGIA